MDSVKRHIILTPGEPPRLEGGWTVGEIQQMAQLLMEWLSQLQVSQPQAANSATRMPDAAEDSA